MGHERTMGTYRPEVGCSCAVAGIGESLAVMLRFFVYFAFALLAGFGILFAPAAAAEPWESPLPPTALRAFVQPDGVVLEWQAPLFSINPVTSYRLYRFTDAEPSREFVAEVPAEALDYVDTSADPDYIYTYYATAMAGGQESPPSNLATPQYPHCFNIILIEPPFVNARCLFPLPIGNVHRLLVLG